MQKIKTFFEMIAPLIGPLTGAVNSISKMKENRKLKKKDKFPLKRNKDDGYYYDDNDDKSPYCPRCYEVVQLKVHIINDKCPECGKVYRTPPPVAVVAGPVNKRSFPGWP